MGFPALKGLTNDLFSDKIWLPSYVKCLEDSRRHFVEYVTPTNALIFSTVTITGATIIHNKPDILNNLNVKNMFSSVRAPSNEQPRSSKKNPPQPSVPAPDNVDKKNTKPYDADSLYRSHIGNDFDPKRVTIFD